MFLVLIKKEKNCELHNWIKWSLRCYGGERDTGPFIAEVLCTKEIFYRNILLQKNWVQFNIVFNCNLVLLMRPLTLAFLSLPIRWSLTISTSQASLQDAAKVGVNCDPVRSFSCNIFVIISCYHFIFLVFPPETCFDITTFKILTYLLYILRNCGFRIATPRFHKRVKNNLYAFLMESNENLWFFSTVAVRAYLPSTTKIVSEVSSLRQINVHCEIWYMTILSSVFNVKISDMMKLGLIQQHDNIHVC